MKLIEDQMSGGVEFDRHSWLGREAEELPTRAQRPTLDNLEALKMSVPENVGKDFWASLLDSLTLGTLSRGSYLSSQVLEQALTRLGTEEDIVPDISSLDLGDQFLLQPVCEELRWVEWAHTSAALLTEHTDVIVEDTVAAQARLLCETREELSSFQTQVESFIPRWVKALNASESECYFQVASLWVSDFCAVFEADFHQWRSLFESLQMAITAHLPEEAAYGLVRQLHHLIGGVPRFDFIGHLARTADKAPSCESFAGRDFVLSCSAELLVSAVGSNKMSPLVSGLLRAESPMQGMSTDNFRAYSNQILDFYRGEVERSWLDNLESLFSRLLAALEWRTIRKEHSKVWNGVGSRAATNLAEVLEHYRKKPRYGKELQYIFEAAFESTLTTRNLAQARALFKPWFVSTYALRESQGMWSQSKAVLAAMTTQLKREGDHPLALLKLSLPVVETIPSLLQSCACLLEGKNAEESPSWSPELQSMAQALLSYDQDGLGQWLSRSLHVRGGKSLDDWLASSRSSFANADATGTMACLWDAESELWNKVGLAKKLWDSGHLIAGKASQTVYDRVPSYAKEATPEGLVKCQRDFTALLRKIAWAALSPGDSVENVKDWWSEFVDSYLVHRQDDLFAACHEALLEHSKPHLGNAELELLERHLTPIMPPSNRPSKAGESSKATPIRYPLNKELAFVGVEPPDFKALGKGLKDREFWLKSLTGQWASYLWCHQLSYRNLRDLRRWLDQNPKKIEEVDTAFQALAKSFTSGKDSVALDYVHSYMDYLRQWKMGVELSAKAAGVAKASSLSSVIGPWLNSLAASLQATAPEIARWKWRQSLVTHATFIGGDKGLEQWREVWQTLSEAQVSPALSALLKREAADLSHLGGRLQSLVTFTSAFFDKTDPVFSPVPDEEHQWKNVLVGLAALKMYSDLPDWTARSLRLCLVESFPLCRESDFVSKLSKVTQVFPGGPNSQDICDLARVVELSQEFSGSTKIWSELEELRHGDLRDSFVGSSWGLPQSAKLELLGLGDKAGLASVDLALGAGSKEIEQELGVKCSRDLSWLARRLQVEQIQKSERSVSGASHWYASHVLAFATSVQPEDHICALGLQLKDIAGRDDFDAHTVAEFWGKTLFHLRDLQMGSCAPLGYRLQVSRPRPASAGTWPAPANLDLEAARQNALKQSQDEATELSAEESTRILSSLRCQFTTYEETGLVSPELSWALQGVAASHAQRFLMSLSQQVEGDQDTPLLERLRIVDYLQACTEFVRQIQLGRELLLHRIEIVEELELEDSQSSQLGRAFLAFVDILQLAPRPLASLNLVSYQLQMSPQPSSFCAAGFWSALLDKSMEYLSPMSHQELTWWSRQMKSAEACLQKSMPLTQAVPTLGLDTWWSTSFYSTLAIRILQEAQPSWTPLLRGFVARSHWGGQAPLADFLGQAESLKTWLRETFIDLELGPVILEIESLEKSWEVLVGLEELKGEAENVLTTLGEKLPEIRVLEPSQVLQLLEGLARLDVSGTGHSSRWRVAACLKILPQKTLVALAEASSGDNLQVALANVIGKYLPFTRESEVGRFLEFAARIPELEKAWSVDEPSLPKIKSVDDSHRRDLARLCRRLTLDGWQGLYNPPEGSFQWCRWDLIALAQDVSAKQFDKSLETVVKFMLESEQYSEPMRRCASEFERNVDLRYAKAGKGASLWEIFSTPVVGGAASYSKPEKRGWWNRISESFEGIVSAIKED